MMFEHWCCGRYVLYLNPAFFFLHHLRHILSTGDLILRLKSRRTHSADVADCKTCHTWQVVWQTLPKPKANTGFSLSQWRTKHCMLRRWPPPMFPTLDLSGAASGGIVLVTNLSDVFRSKSWRWAESVGNKSTLGVNQTPVRIKSRQEPSHRCGWAQQDTNCWGGKSGSELGLLWAIDGSLQAVSFAHITVRNLNH